MPSAASTTSANKIPSGALAAAKVSGYHVAFWAAAAMLGAGAVLLPIFLRKRHVERVSVNASELMATA